MKVSHVLVLAAGLVLGFFVGQATRTTAPSTPGVAQRPGTPPPIRPRPAPDATVYRLPVEDSMAGGILHEEDHRRRRERRMGAAPRGRGGERRGREKPPGPPAT